MQLRATQDVDSTHSKRDELRTQDDVRFINRAEFCELLTSAKKLDRVDFPQARVKGIYAPSLGLHFVIEEEALFQTD